MPSPSPPQLAGRKRKGAFDRPALTSHARKRQKNQNARTIPVQRGQSDNTTKTSASTATGPVAANADLNIAAFIKAREFEISALDKSMRLSRSALMARAFQQVPRHMRRRTASHNVKKVPRRLRRKAAREMKEDNTPTVTKRRRTPSRKLRLRLDRAKLLGDLNKKTKSVRQHKREAKANAKQSDPENHVVIAQIPRLKKNKLAEPPRATVKYKKRQVAKTWLPTHLWHTKRAHMTRPTEPLWRMTIPLSPTEKSYRPSHRAAGQRGCIGWDASFMSTVACRGTGVALESLLRAMGFAPQGLTSALLKKWKAGTRFADGWVYQRDNEKQAIAPVKVVWLIYHNVQAVERDGLSTKIKSTIPEHKAPAEPNHPAGSKKTKLDQQILIRVHPAAFHQFWEELLIVAKLQKPQVLVEDLRFEIGSIEVQGPGSTEALLGVLCPAKARDGMASPHSDLWLSLAGLNNPGILPQNALLSFDICDPRLQHPLKQIKIPNDPDCSRLAELLVSWTPDNTPAASALSSHKARWVLSNLLPSQKAINRRKALAPPGQCPTSNDKDPRIPIILLASRSEASSEAGASSSQGSWTVLLPWSCVDLVWRSLVYYPLSSGGTPRFGGLEQKQQMAFEQQIPWFPADMPGTEAGKAWERTQSELKFDEWIRRPPKHRLAWDKLELGLGRTGEIGRGWACDWEFLFGSGNEKLEPVPVHSPDKISMSDEPALLTQRQRKALKAKSEAEKEATARRRNTSSPESEADDPPNQSPKLDVQYLQLSPAAGLSVFRKPSSASLTGQPSLTAVRLTFLDRGTPIRAARIYRLPTRLSQPTVQPTQASTLPNAESQPQQDQPQSWSSEPPGAQRPPPTLSTAASSSNSAGTDPHDHRARWLSFLPLSASSLSRLMRSHKVPKQKTNRFGLATAERALPRESLARINVLPKNAPPEIVEQYGPKSAFGRGDGEIPREAPRPRTTHVKGKSKGANAKAQVRQREAKDDGAGADLALPPSPPAADLLTRPAAPDFWTQHPPVPHAHDLIGFVTSGGYNLAEGRGTAIGSLWTQRVLEGWRIREDEDADEAGHDSRFLCIVRNPGEGVGRLAIWEVCPGP